MTTDEPEVNLLNRIKKMDLRLRIALEVVIILLLFVAIAPKVYYSQIRKANSFPLVSVKITIPEGYNAKQIAERFTSFTNFDKTKFLKIAQLKEGYLFPDTYFFTGKENEIDVIEKMENNFIKRMEGLKINGEIHPIVIMASILEKEAQTIEDKKIIAGILWKRLDVGMPLQVDASLTYITSKTSSQMTTIDLKIDSPYNTYLYKGLPKGPISNPGLESIKATLNPEPSPYWFYLSDKNNDFHYAETFDGHKINKQKYLR